MAKATKAVSKAQRLKLRRAVGRPRKEGPREPNGRLSRSCVEPIDKLAIETRARMLGLPESEKKNQKAGTYIGYLSLLGPRDGLSQAQYEAAESYLKLRAAYLRAIKAPGALYDPEAPGGYGTDPEDYARWCEGVKAEYNDVRRQIQEAQNYSRENLWAALDTIIIKDERAYHMVGTTRILCNVLARHFKTAR